MSKLPSLLQTLALILTGSLVGSPIAALLPWLICPEKVPERKEHPCMVPYDQLPESQKAKDHLFLAVAKVLMNSTR